MRKGGRCERIWGVEVMASRPEHQIPGGEKEWEPMKPRTQVRPKLQITKRRAEKGKRSETNDTECLVWTPAGAPPLGQGDSLIQSFTVHYGCCTVGSSHGLND